MTRPKICAVIISESDLEAAKKAEPLVDLFEVRIDLIGTEWQAVAKQLKKPWLATNRTASEGGRWQSDEASRVSELLKSLALRPALVDIELQTDNVKAIAARIKEHAKCLVSYHNWERMPPLSELVEIVRRELDAGADICKIAAMVRSFEDNVTLLELVDKFPDTSLIVSGMGPLGMVGRILCPLLGGYLIYASGGEGKESSAGQIPAVQVRRIFDLWSRRMAERTWDEDIHLDRSK
jgi:3-dehydroquinate dehydratase type I